MLSREGSIKQNTERQEKSAAYADLFCLCMLLSLLSEHALLNSTEANWQMVLRRCYYVDEGGRGKSGAAIGDTRTCYVSSLQKGPKQEFCQRNNAEKETKDCAIRRCIKERAHTSLFTLHRI